MLLTAVIIHDASKTGENRPPSLLLPFAHFHVTLLQSTKLSRLAFRCKV